MLGDRCHDELPSGGEDGGRACLWLCVKTDQGEKRKDKQERGKKDPEHLSLSLQRAFCGVVGLIF